MQGPIYCVNNPDLPHSSLKTLQGKQQHELTLFVYFPISSVSPRHNNHILQFKIITASHCTFTQTTQPSARSTISSQFVNPLFTAELWKEVVNDCPQMIHSVPIVCQWEFAACCYVLFCVSDSLQPVVLSCCVSVTICNLLLCPVLSVTVCSLLL